MLHLGSDRLPKRPVSLRVAPDRCIKFHRRYHVTGYVLLQATRDAAYARTMEMLLERERAKHAVPN